MYNEGSAEFNELINKSGGNAPIARFTFADFTIERFAKLEYYGGSNNSDDIAIGTTNMAYLDVSTITDRIITNQEFLFEVGMELSDGTVEYAPMGYFTVQKPDGDENTVDFTAYDRMQKFEKPYFSTLTYPTDSAKVLNELCTMCGVELAIPITNPITITDKLEGYTCREVLGFIAGIHGYFACFDRYGKLNLRWYSETPIEKQIGLIWSLTKSQNDYTVEKITLAKDSETTYTSGDGVSGINYSNPYATQAITDSIYASLGGFTYRPCEISMLDDIRLDPWDVLRVTYLDGSVLTIPVMSLSHSFTNGETKIKSVGKSDTENEYSYSGPVTQAMERMSTELLVANKVIATKVDADWVNAHTVTADKLEATNARVSYLETNALTAETADLRYADITLANIDTANIDVAKIGLLFTQVGLIDRATIVDGHITGFLDAVEINANSITAGTLIADRLLLRGSTNGLLYAINNLGELTSTNVNTLDGTILTKRTITADKLVAKSITTDELDVTNIFGNSAVLSTLTSQTAFINAISTNTVVVGASNTANSALNAVNGLEIGGSNLLLGTKDFSRALKDSAFSLSIDENGFTVCTGTGTGRFPSVKFVSSQNAIDNPLLGKTVVLSLDVKADDLKTSPTNYLIGFEVYGSNNGFETFKRTLYKTGYLSGTGGFKLISSELIDDEWCRLKYSYTIPEFSTMSDSLGTYNEYRYGMAFYLNNSNTGHTASVRKFKMELGNKATDWTPAPEDISVENVYTAGTTTIDGGKITTGSITAASIATSAITTDKLAANAVTATKINVTSLSAITANLGTVTAGQITVSSTAWIPPIYADIGKLTNFINGTATPTSAQKKAFDFDSNGTLDLWDFAYLKAYLLKGKALPSTYTKTTSAVKVNIQPAVPDKCIEITGKNSYGSAIDVYFGLTETNVIKLTASSVHTGYLSVTDETDISGTLSVSGAATFSSTVTSKKNMLVDRSSESDVATSLEVKNSVRDIAVHTSAAGNGGLYDYTNSEWIIRCDTDQIVYIPHQLYVPNIVRINDGTSTYAYMNKQTEGTTSTTGLGQLTAGNNIASGKAGNARGRIALYGTSTGYTGLYPGYAGTSSISINLPSSAGTLALTSSDKRLKENIIDVEVSGLDFINAIKLHQFDWKESGDHWACGYIADELLVQDKHLVLEGSGGFNDDGSINPLCIDDFYLSAYQTKAIQELYQRIIELEKEINILRNVN